MSADEERGEAGASPVAPSRVIRRDEPVMGTVVSFDLRPPVAVADGDAYAALARARAYLWRVDAVFSLWKPQSPMSRVRRGELALTAAPPEIGEVLDRCEEARRLSGGWFDPWAMPGGLDPTGLVKGWAAAKALALVVEAGIADAMVNAGGDIAVAGAPEPGARWRIGVQHPFSRRALIGVVEVDSAIATSGTYERGAHLVDPREHRHRSRFAAATVVGPDLAIADALATALAVGGMEALESVDCLRDYEGLGITPAGGLVRTRGFELEVPEDAAGAGASC